MLTDTIIHTILTAEAKALATTGPHGVNVVPVSVIDVSDGFIYLYNFFMHKTADNINEQSAVALSAWSGLVGVQVKGVAEYLISGEIFNRAVERFQVTFPDRVLTAVIKITPTAVFDVSADSEKAGKLLA